jgi:hypothetical protein
VAIDRESAHELLTERAEAGAAEDRRRSPSRAPEGEVRRPPIFQQRSGGLGGMLDDFLGGRRGRREGLGEAFAKSAARAVGSQVGRAIMRGILGGLMRR